MSCKCEDKLDNATLLTHTYLPIGNIENGMEADIYLIHDLENHEPYLEANTYVHTKRVTRVEVPVAFCPMCGRKLK